MRINCNLFGCDYGENGGCCRCDAGTYDSEYIEVGWLERLYRPFLAAWWAVRKTWPRTKCDHCGTWFWRGGREPMLPGRWCCSEQCEDRWVPFSVHTAIPRRETMYACTCSNDHETADVSDRYMRHARKAHRCQECRGPINAGETYEQIDMLFDGEWLHFKTCRTCAEIAKTFQSCGRAPGVLWEDIHEANCNVYSDNNKKFCICPESLRPSVHTPVPAALP